MCKFSIHFTSELPEYLLFCDLLLLGSEVLFRRSHSCTESIQCSFTSAKLSFLKCNLC